MLVRHLASMATGHLDDTWQRVVAADLEQPVRGFLRLAAGAGAGQRVRLQPVRDLHAGDPAAAGDRPDAHRLPPPRLLDPLGIGPVGWQQHPLGQDLGFTGLHATTDAVARLGQLYLQRGRWGERQLLSEEWVAEATRVHVANPRAAEPRLAPGLRLPVLDAPGTATAATAPSGSSASCSATRTSSSPSTAATEAMQSVLDAVWEHLLPAVDRGSSERRRPGARRAAGHAGRAGAAVGGPARGAVARRRPGSGRRDLCRPAVAAQRRGAAHRRRVAAGPGRGDRRVRRGPADARGERPALVTHAGTGPRACRPRWAVAGPRLGALRFEVRFLETPHTLALTVDPVAGTFDARWTGPAAGHDPPATAALPATVAVTTACSRGIAHVPRIAAPPSLVRFRMSRPLTHAQDEVCTVVLPRLTPEQRQANLEKAAASRRERAEIKNRLKHSGASITEVLQQGRDNEVVGKMRVIDLLQSMPGLGKVRARQMMERLEHLREPAGARPRRQPDRRPGARVRAPGPGCR